MTASTDIQDTWKYFPELPTDFSPGDGMIVVRDNKTYKDSFESARDGISENLQLTGWGTYVDTQYPVGSQFAVAANTDTLLPNNAGSKIETQKPADVVTFYDGSVITGREGDGIDIMIYFKAVPTAPAQYIDIWIDIGGTVGELYRQTFSFPKGAGIDRGILYPVPSAYTLGTWEANGASVYVRSDSILNIYDINYNIDRNHKAR
jgi:hypothetical protein